MDSYTLESRELTESALVFFLEAIDCFVRVTGLRVLSRRVVTPPFSDWKLPGLLHELVETHGVNHLSVPLSRGEPGVVSEILNLYPRLFLSVEYSPTQEEEVAKALRMLSKSSCLYATRFAVSLGKRPQTPYFLVRESQEAGVSMSLLCAEFFRRDFNGSLQPRLKEPEAQANLSYGICRGFLGFDLSLSPWLERSVARVVEEASGGYVHPAWHNCRY